MEFFEILNTIGTALKKLVDFRRSEWVRNLRRLERTASRMHRQITGARLRRLERFSDTELIRIFRQDDRTETVRERLFASGRVVPYARILYWLWLYTEQRGLDDKEQVSERE